MTNFPEKAYAQDHEQLGTTVIHIRKEKKYDRKEKEDGRKERTILHNALPPILAQLQPVQLKGVMLLLTFLHILPQWDEAGNNRGSATALLLRCQEENQRHPVEIRLTRMDRGVHLWVLQNPTMLFSTSDLIKSCNENIGWVFLKEFNIVLSLLKSNTMREVPDFKREGRKLKHSPSEIFI